MRKWIRGRIPRPSVNLVTLAVACCVLLTVFVAIVGPYGFSRDRFEAAFRQECRANLRKVHSVLQDRGVALEEGQLSTIEGTLESLHLYCPCGLAMHEDPNRAGYFARVRNDGTVVILEDELNHDSRRKFLVNLPPAQYCLTADGIIRDLKERNAEACKRGM